jgi:hypothetical protein
MQGDAGEWDPWTHVRERHPGVQVIETDRLPSRVQGCVDHKRRIIWLAAGLSAVQARCALAFELGQFQQGPPPSKDPCLARARQLAAREWAALMLIPSDVFVQAWQDCLDLTEMAAFCNVDVPTFRNRIRAASDADQDAAIAAIIDTRLSA